MQKWLWLGAAIMMCAFSADRAYASVEGDVRRLSDAATVLTEIHSAPDSDIPQGLWDKAHCVVVIPDVKKAAFIVGGEYGKGVMSCHASAGWSAPSFVVLQKGSVGFQIGAESVDLVLLIMNEQGISKLLDDKFTFGAEASVAAGPVGRDARAMTDAQMNAQILSYFRAKGVFAGFDLTGGVLKPDNDENRDFYGRDVTARAMLTDRTVKATPAAKPFLNALRRSMPKSRTQ